MCAPVSLRFCSLLGLAMAPALTNQSQGFSTLPESPASSPTETPPPSHSHSSSTASALGGGVVVHKKIPASAPIQPSTENRLERKLEPPLTNGNHSPTLGCQHGNSEEDGASGSMGPLGFTDKIGGVAPEDVDLLLSHLDDTVVDNHVSDLLDDALEAEVSLKEAPPTDADLGLSEAELTAIAARLTEQNLLNLCDVTEPITSSVSLVDAVPREEVAAERLAEVSRKQELLVRRSQRLLRRLQKLQARQTAKHVTQEVQQCVQVAQANLQVKVPPHAQLEEQLLATGRFPRREDVRHISTASLVNLVKRLEAPAAALWRPKKYFASGRTPVSHVHQPAGTGATASTLGWTSREEVATAAGQWAAQLNHLQRALDEDLTASSSGGESGDESQSYVLDCYKNGQETQLDAEIVPSVTCPIWRRACWRWAKERAALAARWVWLQAQVSDLEYRIRQHTEIVRQLRSAKGAVAFDSPEAMLATTATAAESDLPGSARTRPLATSTFRKRRLVRPGVPVPTVASQASGPNPLQRKASRLSAVKCNCLPGEVTPCALCSGRKHFRVTMEPDFMTVRERIARVDPAFHPILSAMHEVSVGDHIGSLLKNQDWRREAARARRSIALATVVPPPNAVHNPVNTAGLPSSVLSSQQQGATPSHQSGASHHPNSASDSADSRKKKRGRRPFKHQRYQRGASCDTPWEDPSFKKRKRFHRLSSGASRASDWDRDDWFDPDSPCPSQTSQNAGSGVAGPSRERGSTSSSVYQDLLRRKSGYDYDIDDIVIPYSMAASTRVERLQYKEILTPKWRVVENNNEPSATLPIPVTSEDPPGLPTPAPVAPVGGNSPLVEDLSEETIMQRHDRSEVEERKKFMSYMKPKGSRARARANRTDSRAESSGANTPDPQEDVGELEPPSLSNISAEVAESHPHRRRMSSLSRSKVGNTSSTNLSSWDDSCSVAGEQGAWPYEIVPPYEPRQFPLPDSVLDDMVKEMPEEEEQEEGEQRTSETGRRRRGTGGGGAPEEEKNREAAKAESDEEKMDEIRASSRASSTDSFETASAMDDDPDDPEWNNSKRPEDGVSATPPARQNPRR